MHPNLNPKFILTPIYKGSQSVYDDILTCCHLVDNDSSERSPGDHVLYFRRVDVDML